jgi:2-keto-4-pentenoate hydratase/2-oxohepta-3-ene-1,7-dioic acid hydratase in catechol pathway
MKRRAFLSAAALPVLAAAQSPDPVRVAAAKEAATMQSPLTDSVAGAPRSLPAGGREGPAHLASGLIVANLRGPGGPRLAVKTKQGLLDVTVAARALGMTVPRDTDALITDGPGQLGTCIAAALGAHRAEWVLNEDQAPFAPAVGNPRKIVCVGLNYRRHAREIGMAEPKVPILFNKFNNALTHHRAVVPTSGLPGTHFDYECELVIVMGRRCVNVPESQALDYVFGYCTGNDFSERSSQLTTSQWLAGKSSDGFAPLGPYLVAADLVADPNAQSIETRVNGELRQSSSTADFIFNCHQIIAYTSRLFPLEPGDIIYTGTPEGVVLGMPKERQVWLKTGDKVATTVGKLGTLEITVG